MTDPAPSPWLARLGRFIVPLTVFLAIAPTLTWVEFSSGLENLNITTALELRRDHAPTLAPADSAGRPGWLIPTLEAEPRVKKPPFTAWITALGIRPSTLAALEDLPNTVALPAYQRLAFDARWPALLAACLMLIAIFELGSVVADHAVGLVAAIVAATTLLFLRFSRFATIDVHLALWVTLANVFLAHAVLKGRRWSGCLLAALAMGVSFMIKGPIPLVQTLVPVLLFAIVRRLAHQPGRPRPPFKPWIGPILVATLVFCAVALPWFIAVIRLQPGGWNAWLKEATEPRGLRPSPFYAYFAFLPYMLPWTVPMIGGLISARRNMLLVAFLMLAPLVLMSLYKDRQERYMFPMIGAGAVLAAHGLITLARKTQPWDRLEKAAVIQHWILLVLIGLATPALAATWLGSRWAPTADLTPWIPRAWGASITAALGITIAAFMLTRNNWLPAILAASLIVMLAVAPVVIHGYARTTSGRSAMLPLAQALRKNAPDAIAYNAHPRGKRTDTDLAIYYNRVTHLITAEKLRQLQPIDKPQVVILLQDQQNPDPPPPPTPQWKFVHKVLRDNDWFWAYVLPPQSPQ